MNNYIQIKEIIDEYIKLMDLLTNFENEKLEAVKMKDINKLDTFLKEEQVYLLKLRGLDKKREEIQKNMGVEGMTYREIIQTSEGSLRNELESSYDVLSAKTKQFNQILNTLKTYIDIRIHTIDTFMKRIGAESSQKAKTGIYDNISRNEEKAPDYHIKSTKV